MLSLPASSASAVKPELCTMLIIDLPRELIETILALCDPIDVGQIAQTCRFFQKLVNEPEDDALWRNLYLAQVFDDPRQCVSQVGEPRPPVHWRHELQRIIRARSLINNMSIGRPGEITTVLQTLLDLVCYAPPLTTPEASSELSKDLIWIPVLLCRGWIDFVAEQTLTNQARQLLERLHTYFGLTQNDIKKETLVASRAYVYNMRNYSWQNDFGPFTLDGGVNWVHVRAIHHVVSMQVLGEEVETDPEKFEYAVYPMSLPFTQIYMPEGKDMKEEKDWAGVAGDWIVSFCFCDHRELLVFNEGVTSSGVPADTSIFEADDFREVFRCMSVVLKVSNTEPNPNYPTKPTIFFYGIMKDLSNSVMNGSVRMTPDGHVRWRFISGEPTNTIWSSEGLQIGGLQSSYGVLGSWTTIFHDADDPVGPFWLRKVQSGQGTQSAD